jgi:hypothetical protein
VAVSQRNLLLSALAGAAGLWYWSRTRQGAASVEQITDSTGRLVTDLYTEGARMVSSLLPRGIRNNNPGNIDRRPGVKWQGMADDQSTDSRFVVFKGPEWGLRAIARVLRTYQQRGNVTIAQIISTWAPPSENNTNAYIAAVSNEVGIPPNAPVSAANIPGIVAAIVRHENGQQPYPPEVIARGVELERTA